MHHGHADRDRLPICRLLCAVTVTVGRVRRGAAPWAGKSWKKGDSERRIECEVHHQIIYDGTAVCFKQVTSAVMKEKGPAKNPPGPIE